MKKIINWLIPFLILGVLVIIYLFIGYFESPFGKIIKNYNNREKIVFLKQRKYVETGYSEFSLDEEQYKEGKIIYCDEIGIYYYNLRKKDNLYEVKYVDLNGNNRRSVAQTKYTCMGKYNDYIFAYDENGEQVLLDINTYELIDGTFSMDSDYKISDKSTQSEVILEYLDNEYIINKELLFKGKNIGQYIKKYGLSYISVDKKINDDFLISCYLYDEGKIDLLFYESMSGLYVFKYNPINDSITFLSYSLYGTSTEYFYLEGCE